MKIIRLNKFIVLIASFAFIACTCSCSPKETTNPKSNSKVTKLTYTINLGKQDAEGCYLGTVDKPVVIRASAEGPNKDKAKWIVSTHCESNGNMNWSGDIISSGVQSRNLKDEFSFTAKAIDLQASATVTLDCHPVLESVDGVNLYEGTQVFKVKFQTNP